MILSNSELDYSTIRKLVIEVLKNGVSQYGDIRSGVANKLTDYGYSQETTSFLMSYSRSYKELSKDDEDKVNQVVWDLIIERILTIGLDGTNNEWPFLRLTEFGKKIIKNEESVIVYDINGMINLLRKKIPSVDPVIEKHLSECLNTVRINALLASSVMLGCAAEKSILLLFDAYLNWINVNFSQKEYQNLERFQKNNISRKFDELTKSISGHKPHITPELLEDYDLMVNSIFTLIIKNRNDSGHPTGKSIERDELISMIYVFINHCKKIYDFIEFFETNKVKEEG